MKRTASILSAWLLSFGIQTGSAARVEPAPLPSPVHIDTEISTNCILRIGDGVSRTFAFTLDFDATPSNNVQIAFGHDADTDGVLSIEETGMTVGWDCGTWFVNGAAEEADGLSETPTVRDGRKALRFELLLQADGSPRRLTIRDGENDLFQALSASLPAWMCDSSWDLMRLTARGVDAPNECFEAHIEPDRMIFLLR